MTEKVRIQFDGDSGPAVRGAKKLDEALDGARAAAEGAAKGMDKLEAHAERLKNEATALKQKFADFDRAVANSRQQTQGLLGATGGAGSSFSNMAKTAGLAAGGVAALGFAAVEAHAKVTELAEASLNVQNVFNNLTFSIEPARQATQGLISDMDLATSANQLSALGVAKNAQEFARLAEAAQKLGARINLGPKEALESLGAALGRGSTEMLDNLGIVLKTSQAHDIYAKSLGKTVGELTDAEKAEAFRKVAMDKIIAAAKDVTIVTDGSAAAVRRFNVELDNIRTKALGGGDGPIMEFRDAMVELEQQGLLPGESSLRSYGSEVDALRSRLREMGVQVEDMPDTIDDWVDSVVRADKAVDRLNENLKLNEERFRQLVLQGARAAGEANVLAATAARQQELDLIEEQLVFEQARGAEQSVINDLKVQQLMLDAEILELAGENAKAAEKRRKIELEFVKMQGASQRVRRGGGGGRRDNRSELERQLSDFNPREFGATDRDGIAAELFGTSETVSPDFDAELEKIREFEAAKVDIRLNERLREIEAGTEMGIITDPIQAINMEEEARLEHLEFLKEHASSKAEVLRLEDEAAEVAHEAEMKRIAERNKAKEREREVYTKVGDAVTNVMTGIASTAIRAAMSEEGSVKKKVAAFAKANAIEMTIITASETIKAAVAAASYNYPKAANHLINAGLAGAQAAAFGALAGGLGGFGGRAGGGGRGNSSSFQSRLSAVSPGGGGSGGSGGPESNLPDGPISGSSTVDRSTGGTRSTPSNVTIVYNKRSITGSEKEADIRELRKLFDQSQRRTGGV